MEHTFDGVFKFTNASDEDFIARWNNKDYIFPAQTTCPMIISGESPENIQNIRKKWALKWAQREFFKSKEGKNIEKVASKQFIPATYDEKLLEPFIQQCLSPLPLSSTIVKDAPKQNLHFIEGGTAIIGDGSSLGSLSSKDGEFGEYVPPVLGAMPNSI